MNLINQTSLSAIADQYFGLVCKKLKSPEPGRVYYADSVYCKIKKQIPRRSTNSEYNFFTYLEQNHEKVIKGDIAQLDKIIRDIRKIMSDDNLAFSVMKKGKQVPTALLNKVWKCFDYTAFSKSTKPYETLKLLQIDACPYCNRHYVSTYISSSGKTRATLDHFYSKSKYPYLALSFYNLIPSCYPCNSSLKRDIEFSSKTHLNPYFKSFENIKKFTVNYSKEPNSMKYIAEFYADPNFMQIEFVNVPGASKADINRANNNIRDLKIQELYNLHKDQVVELLQKNVIYKSNGYAKSIVAQYPKLFNSENDVYRLLLGNYVEEKDFNKRPFSRMNRDIANELKLLNKIR